MSQIAIVIKFPVQTHVYKYLQQKVGPSMMVSRSNFFGNLVLDILSKREKAEKAPLGTMVFPVEIHEDYMNRFGFNISPNVIRKFNLQVDRMFKEEMCTYVSLTCSHNPVKKTEALSQFLNSFDISEDDIKTETLIKYIFRNEKDKKTFGQNVL